MPGIVVEVTAPPGVVSLAGSIRNAEDITGVSFGGIVGSIDGITVEILLTPVFSIGSVGQPFEWVIERNRVEAKTRIKNGSNKVINLVESGGNTVTNVVRRVGTHNKIY